MKNHLLILAGIFFIGALSAETKPNVLFIAVDDMNDWIGCLETTPRALTPNIDRLAARGVNFTNAHTAGVFCAPSRAAIFTGQFASTTGCYTTANYFYDHPEIRPLQVSFAEGGYQTFGAGKLFHHPAGAIDQRGWTEFFLRNQSQRETGWPLDSWSEELPKPDQKLEGRSLAGILADPTTAKNQKVFLPYMEPGAYAVIDRQWRYIRYADGSEELYQVRKDPNEWENLAMKPEFEKVKANYRKAAPKSFAEPAFKLKPRQHLILEGESFRWEVK